MYDEGIENQSKFFVLHCRYISRPLLIRNRKFDIRVHWLVAWTKPLLVFYNHKASVVRLSLNLYREFDNDRATHLTNLVKKFFLVDVGNMPCVFLVRARKSLSLCGRPGIHRHDNESTKVKEIHCLFSFTSQLTRLFF